jgi:hypothetical protein
VNINRKALVQLFPLALFLRQSVCLYYGKNHVKLVGFSDQKITICLKKTAKFARILTACVPSAFCHLYLKDIRKEKVLKKFDCGKWAIC